MLSAALSGMDPAPRCEGMSEASSVLALVFAPGCIPRRIVLLALVPADILNAEIENEKESDEVNEIDFALFRESVETDTGDQT